MRKFRIGFQMVCTCDRMRGVAPETAWTESGHLAVAGSDIADWCGLSQSARNMLVGNSRETALPSEYGFLCRFNRDVMQFIVDNRLSFANCLGIGIHQIKTQLRVEAKKHWTLHAKHLKTQHVQKASMDDVAEIRHAFCDLVIHNEDHKYGRTCLYCPQLYGQCILNTFWGADGVFEEVDTSPSEADRIVRAMLPAAVRRSCSCGIARENTGVDQTVPEAYVIMKRKKGFSSGRSLIPCHKKWLRKLHQAIGKLLAHWFQVEIQDATFDVSDTVEAAMKIKKFCMLR